MIEVYAVSDGVRPIDRVVPRVERRRERSPRDTPFPALPGEEKEPEEEPAPAAPVPTPEPKDDDSEHKIDIHVLSLILPTRQLLPPPGCARTAH